MGKENIYMLMVVCMLVILTMIFEKEKGHILLLMDKSLVECGQKESWMLECDYY